MRLSKSGILAVAALLAGCTPTLPNTKLVPYLQDTLGPTWTIVPLPNTALVPGAIVQVLPPPASKQGAGLDLRLLGRLSDCAVPPAAVVTNDAAVPGISAGSTFKFDASVGAKLAGVSASVAANAGAQTVFTVGAASDSTLDFITFQRWATDPANGTALSQACGTILGQTGVYVVQEAFVISAGSFTFQTSAGGKIDVTPPPNVPVTAGADAQTGKTGALTITQPIVFALKVLQPLPAGGFQVAALATAPRPHFAVPHASRPDAGPLLLGGMPIGSVEGLPVAR